MGNADPFITYIKIYSQVENIHLHAKLYAQSDAGSSCSWLQGLQKN